MRQIAAKALIFFLAVIIAAILVAPQVDLDPVTSRLEWAACLLIVFLAWLAGMAEEGSAGSDAASLSSAHTFTALGHSALNPLRDWFPLLRC